MVSNRIRLIRLACGFGLLIAAGCGQNDGDQQADDANRGATAKHAEAAALYAATCASCHGSEAQGNALQAAPRLAGQHASYLQRQLAHFISGERGANDASSGVGPAMMAAAVASLEPQSLRPLSTYLSSLQASVASASSGLENVDVTPDEEQARLARGKKVYQSRCAACHGHAAAGNAATGAAMLAGLSADYLTRQFLNYQNGLRGTAKGDSYGAQMRAIASTLSDADDIDAVSRYLESIPAK